MKEVEREAKRRKVKLLILPTIKAIEVLEEDPPRHQRDHPRDMLSAAAGTPPGGAIPQPDFPARRCLI
jgi:hypothetical protein